jgi:hypothetical protein
MKMPKTRRHFAIMLLILLGIGAAIYLVPTTFEKRFLTLLFEGIGEGEPFEMAQTTDFSWHRVCAYPRGTPESDVNILLGPELRLRLKDFDASGLIFIAKDKSLRPVILPIPGYVGQRGCWQKPDTIMVHPGDTPGAFKIEGR